MEMIEVSQKGKIRKFSKRIHLEIAPDNWRRMKDYINYYNKNPDRFTAEIKLENVVNDALNDFFSRENIS